MPGVQEEKVDSGLRQPGHLPNGQIYFKAEKRHGMRTLSARMPSRKQRRRWRRMLRRMGMSAYEYERFLALRHRGRVLFSGQGR